MTITDAEIRRIQSSIRELQAYDQHGAGDPNGVRDAPAGATFKRDTGQVYRKTTGLGTLTGWVTP